LIGKDGHMTTLLKPVTKTGLPFGKRKFVTNLSCDAWEEFREKAQSLGMPMSKLLEVIVVTLHDPDVDAKIRTLKPLIFPDRERKIARHTRAFEKSSR
jgi:hypothetical protein